MAKIINKFNKLLNSVWFRKILFYGLPIVILITSLFPIVFLKNFVGVTGDNPFSLLKENFLYWSVDKFSIWNENNFGSPYYYPTEISINVILGFVVWIGVPTAWISKLVIILSLIFGYFSIHRLISYFNQSKEIYNKIFISLISYLYIFNPLVFTRIGMSHYWYLIAYSITPFIILCSLCKSRKVFLLGLLFFWISMIQIQFIVFGIIFIVLFTWMFAKISRNECLFRTILLFAFTLLVNLFWILPFRSQQIALFITNDNILSSLTRQSLFLDDALKGSGYNFDFYSDLMSNSEIYKYWYVLGYLPFFLYIIGTVQLYREKEFKIANIFLAILSITLFVITGFKYFLKDLFHWIATNFTPFALFRELYHLQFIIFIVFFIVGSFAIRFYFDNLSTYLKKILLGFLSLLIILYSIPFLQINSDRYVPQITESQSNSYQILNKLNTKASKGQYRMLYIPLNSIVRYDQDQFIWGRNKFLSDTGIPTTDTSSLSEFAYAYLYKQLYDSISNINLDLNQKYFKSIMNRYSFKYFVLDQIVTPIDKFDIKTMEMFLDQNYPRILKSDGVKVYENTSYIPLMTISNTLTDINIDPLDIKYFEFDRSREANIYYDSYGATTGGVADSLDFNKKLIDLNKLIERSDLSNLQLSKDKINFPIEINSSGDYDVLKKNNTSKIQFSCQNNVFEVRSVNTSLKVQDNNKLSFESLPGKLIYTGRANSGISVLELGEDFINIDNCNKDKIQWSKYISTTELLNIKSYKLNKSENIFIPLEDGNIQSWTTIDLCGINTIPKSEKEVINSVKKQNKLNLQLRADRGTCLNKTLNLNSQKDLIGITTVTTSDSANIQIGIAKSNGDSVNSINIKPKSIKDKNNLYANVEADKAIVTLNINNINDSLSLSTIDEIILNTFEIVDNIYIKSDKSSENNYVVTGDSVSLEKSVYDINLDVSESNSIENGNFDNIKLWNPVGDCNSYDNKIAQEINLNAKVISDDESNILELSADDHAPCIYQAIPSSTNSNYFLNFQYKTINGYPPSVVFSDSSGKTISKIDNLSGKNEWNNYKAIIKIPANEKFFITVSQNTYQNGFLRSSKSQFKNFELREINENLDEFLIVRDSNYELKSNIKTNLNYISSTKYVLDVITDRDFYYTNGQVFHPGWAISSSKPEFISVAQFNQVCEKKSIITKEICNVDKPADISGNTKLIPEKNHIKVNNFHNGWHVKLSDIPEEQKIDLGNGLKSVRIVVEYQPQKLFNFGLIFYAASLSVILLWATIPRKHFD